MTNRGFALLFIVLLAGSGNVFAQSNAGTEQLYSAGVHAFNSQRHAEAISWFNQLEAKGTQDPRAFFFRGLAYGRLGDAVAANADFETAARMELTVAGRSYSVPKALERIQGRERTTIEQHRRAAKRAWEAEENLRRQNEFLTQKAENQKLYQTIISSGESATASTSGVDISGLALPFGAQPAAPYGGSKALSQPKAVGVTQGEMTDDNIFKADVERPTVIAEPEPPAPRTEPRPQDPGERGAFDIFNKEGDEAEGFDASALLQGGGSASRSPGSGLGLSNFLSSFGSGNASGSSDDFDDFGSAGDEGSVSSPGGWDDTELGDNPFDGGGFGDNDSPMTVPWLGETNFGSESMPFGTTPAGGLTDPVKDNGRFFGKGFASLFKKSGESAAPADEPVATPSSPVPTPDVFDVSDDEAIDPFDTDVFDESF